MNWAEYHMEDQIVETWTINNRINLYLLDAIEPEALGSLLTGSRSRTVARMFAHIHNIRCSWLESAAPELLKGVKKIAASTKIDAPLLQKSIDRSGRAIELLLERAMAEGKVKGYKLHPAAFLGYLISHEAYHRGEICVALTQSGHQLDDSILHGQWDWERR
jgi:uncharacterized damage-inducible protein DinB